MEAKQRTANNSQSRHMDPWLLPDIVQVDVPRRQRGNFLLRGHLPDTARPTTLTQGAALRVRPAPHQLPDGIGQLTFQLRDAAPHLYAGFSW